MTNSACDARIYYGYHNYHLICIKLFNSHEKCRIYSNVYNFSSIFYLLFCCCCLGVTFALSTRPRWCQLQIDKLNGRKSLCLAMTINTVKNPSEYILDVDVDIGWNEFANEKWLTILNNKILWFFINRHHHHHYHFRLYFDNTNAIAQQPTPTVVYTCCPGWAKIHHNSVGCQKRKWSAL